MIKALIEVRESLKLVEPIDTAELETLINEAKKIDLTKYTPESVEYLQIMNGIANDVLENPTTQEDVDRAYTALTEAFSNLKLKETNGGKDKQPLTGIEGNVSYVYITLVLASVSLLFILKRRNLLFKK